MGKRGRRRAQATPFTVLIDQALHAWGGVDRRGYDRAIERLEEGGRAAAAAVAGALRRSLDALWTGGWTPSTVVHVTGRQLSAAHAAVVAAAVVAEATDRREAGEALHPRWEAQVNLLAEQGRARARADIRSHLDVLGMLLRLPTMPPTIPPPGDAAAVAEDHIAGLDERVLAKVRALLAKAESTEFEAEAEALTAKAQELIARHAIDDVALHRHEDVGEPSLRHVLLDDPYMDAKAALLGSVASANRCRSVYNPGFGWVTVVGYDGDLDAVELLSASLLAQATAAMARLGPQRDARGRSRTKSFRRAFLYGFADRIGQRLAQATAEQVDTANDLLPVLAARNDRVDAAVQATFPRLRSTSTRLTNGGGYGAGQDAAQHASIDVASGALR